MTNTQQILSNFQASVETNKTYTLAELTTLLKTAYKSSNTSKKSSGDPDKPKKAPSAYNIFIKEQMELLKNDGASPKDRMRQATANWNKLKLEKVEVSATATAENVESDESD